MNELLKTYTSYNTWANKRIIGLLDNEIANKEVKSSFPTIRLTLFHTWNAEKTWLLRMQNVSNIAWPPLAYTDHAAFDAFLDISLELEQFVNRQTDDFFQVLSTYKNSKGNVFVQSNAQIIMHCMNHSTFHRGQIITMLRELGKTDLIATDLIAYYREVATARAR